MMMSDAPAERTEIALEEVRASVPRGMVSTELSGTSARQASPVRAFAFDELGVFGVHGAVAANASSAGSIDGLVTAAGPARAVVKTPAEAGPASKTETPAKGAQAAGDAPGPAAGLGVSEAASSSAGSPLGGEHTLLAAANLANGRPELSATLPAATDDDKQSAATIPVTREDPKADIVLLASGPDGALQVMVALPGSEADSLSALRNATERAAAEFGLRLGGLSVNGRKAPMVKVSHLGASDGRRTS